MALLESLNVLIVEDEPLIAMVLADIVESLGGQVTEEAFTLRAAEAAAQEARYDVAILDINLRGEMSYPAARRIHRRGLPFFFVTGYAHRDVPPDLDHVPIVSKPYDTQAIMRAGASVLSRSRLAFHEARSVV